MTTPSIKHIAFASFIGTAIEFYDFYIYAMAAALVIGQVFFPASDPAMQSLNALLTFGLAFIARPFGAVLFGHFGDRIGRKSTLAASLLVMGSATFLIGLLPGYAAWGVWAPVLLCLLRFAQGIGLGGEWAGAALLATEYAPAGQRSWYGMFPQLGPSIGFLLATLTFLGLSLGLTETQFEQWGWRVPFVISAVLVIVGLYVRFKLAETPVFAQAQSAHHLHRWPLKALLSQHGKAICLGALAMGVCYHLFYTATVFCLSYGTQTLHMSRPLFLGLLCIAVIGMALATPMAAWWADRLGRRPVLMSGQCLAIMLGFALSPMFGSGSWVYILLFLFCALFLMGVTFAPMGAFLPEQFPVAVRYSGAGLSYQLGGILGASFAPAIAQALVQFGGLPWVGGYLSIMALISLLAVWRMPPDAAR
ncbi:MFS transporter [Methylophilus medardicus]|uniref:MHS family MFS transporter n=1 Tax=Methylophilus medardicus TaxID=2588534 RepID=A0A5B8CQ94_9PROT|nr:MFS transporter [Methylophilus medardicus]QDC43412.1 MHS family MFS transporter [Methylophilus medardicus]QDC48419.1 MHS family MFS transporter [Methylophilus medardicus]QDC52124.1 MHS family MFS transporter [Methylophilus medardicus]